MSNERILEILANNGILCLNHYMLQNIFVLMTWLGSQILQGEIHSNTVRKERVSFHPLFMRKLKLREVMVQGSGGLRTSTQTLWYVFHWTGRPRKEAVGKRTGLGR